jgi:hypothetical protein
MISFEEFKTEYKEVIELGFIVDNHTAQTPIHLELNFNSAEEGDVKQKILSVDNSFQGSMPAHFGIHESTAPFTFQLKTAGGEDIVGKVSLSFHEMVKEPNFLVQKEFKGQTFSMRFWMVVGEDSFPMYNMVVSAQNLPLLTGLFGECDPFLRILKKNTNFGTYAMVYESEVIRNMSSPTFRPVKLSVQRLCGGTNW